MFMDLDVNSPSDEEWPDQNDTTTTTTAAAAAAATTTAVHHYQHTRVAGASIFILDVSGASHNVHSQAAQRIKFVLKVIYDVYLAKVRALSSDLLAVLLMGAVTSDRRQICLASCCSLLQLARPDFHHIRCLDRIVSEFDSWWTGLTTVESYSLHNVMLLVSLSFNEHLSNSVRRVLLFTAADQPPDCATEWGRARALATVTVGRQCQERFLLLPLAANFNSQLFYELCFGACHVPFTDRHDQLLRQLLQLVALVPAIRRMPLYITAQLAITVRLYRLIRPARKPKLLAGRSSSGRGGASQEPDAAAASAAGPSGRCWKIADRSVHLTSADMRELHDFGEPCVRIVGYLAADKAVTHDYVLTPYFLRADDHTMPGSGAVLAALVTRCQQRHLAALAQLHLPASVHRCYLLPQLGSASTSPIRPPSSSSAVPTPPSSHSSWFSHSGTVPELAVTGFHVIVIPYRDDYRKIGPPGNTGHILASLTDDQLGVAKQLVTKLQFNYSPQLFGNPELQQLWASCEAIALDRQQTPVLPDMTEADAETIETEAGSLIRRLLSLTEDTSASASASAETTGRGQIGRPIDPDSVHELFENGQLDRLTVLQLRRFLQSAGLAVGVLRKQNLIAKIIDYFTSH